MGRGGRRQGRPGVGRNRRDGRSIVHGANVGLFARLWRVAADGAAPPEPTVLAGSGSYPFAAWGSDRLGFLRQLTDTDICQWRDGSAPVPLFTSPSWDFLPHYSPDGRRVAFTSARTGEQSNVWLGDADGSNVAKLTRGPARGQGASTWSPDGRTIAFDSQASNGRFDIWTIGADGSGPRQVTGDPADEQTPSWSHDGKFICYSSNRTGRSEIWRIPARGGSEEQVTREGGRLALANRDGRWLYYSRSTSPGPLLAREMGRGTERTVTACVYGFAYAVAPEGVVYVGCGYAKDAPTYRVLHVWNAETGQDREVTTIETGRWDPMGLAVSPDGQTVLYTRVNVSADLMMIENFR